MTEEGRSVPTRGSARYNKYFKHDHSSDAQLGKVDADTVDTKHYYTADTQAEMLALTPVFGTLCFRADTKELYIYIGP